MSNRYNALSWIPSWPVKLRSVRLVTTLVAVFVFILTILSNSFAATQEPPATINTADPEFIKRLKSSSEFSIAILPMENMTVEGDIAYHFRMRLTQRLRAKGFSVIDNTKVDAKLHQLGVNHAGQLRLVSFEQLQALTSADAFLSGVVEQGAVQHAGIYNSYVFSCSLKLQDRDSRVIWSSLQNRIAKRRFAIDPINAFLDIALTEGAGDMQQAIYALADRMLANFPEGPVQVVTQEDSLLNQAIETTAKEE